MKEKYCSKCQQSKPISEWSKNKRRHDGLGGYCKKCTNEDFKVRRKIWKKNPEYVKKYRKWNKKSYDKLKQEMLDAYGHECQCCNEKREEFLSIDHPNGGGNAHRKSLGNSRKSNSVWRECRNLGFPKGMYRVLCHNCNMSYGIYGYCPHQKNLTN